MFVETVMTKDEIFEVFTFFNEKAEKLRQMTFVKLALESDSGLKLQYKAGQPLVAMRTGPDQESIEAFILTFRLFIQDNDGCSFRNMSKVYEQPILEASARERFEKIRSALNTFLDKDSYVVENGSPLSYRKVMNTFIYGGLSHADPKYKKDYEAWMTLKTVATVFENEFVFVVREVMYLIWQVRNLNHIAMNRSNLGFW